MLMHSTQNNQANHHSTSVTKTNTPPSETDTNKVLMRAKTSEFFDFLADELVIQEKSVSVIHRSFLSWDVETIQISDMSEVLYSSDSWHSQLSLIGKNPQEKLCIEDLPEEDAEKAKALLEQLLVKE